MFSLLGYPHEFAEPIIRIIISQPKKGIIVSTGYAGKRMDNGLVSCLTDGHSEVSGRECSTPAKFMRARRKTKMCGHSCR